MDPQSDIRRHILLAMFQDLKGVTMVVDGMKLALRVVYWDLWQPEVFHFRVWQAASMNGISRITIEFGGWGHHLVLPEIVKEFVSDLVIVAPGVSVHAILEIWKGCDRHSVHQMKWWVERVQQENGLLQCSRDWHVHNKNLADCFRFQSLTLQHLGEANLDQEKLEWMQAFLDAAKPLRTWQKGDGDGEGHGPGEIVVEDETGHAYQVGVPQNS